MKRFAFTLVALWCFAPPGDVRAQTDAMARIDEFAWNGPTFLKSANPEYIRSLGKVSRESSEVASNPHTDGSVTYRTFQLDGLEIQQRSLGTPIQHQLISITVNSPRWSVKDGLVVGAPVKRVLKVLGEPTERKVDRLTYLGESERIVFKTKNGRVAQIRFVYYAD